MFVARIPVSTIPEDVHTSAHVYQRAATQESTSQQSTLLRYHDAIIFFRQSRNEKSSLNAAVNQTRMHEFCVHCDHEKNTKAENNEFCMIGYPHNSSNRCQDNKQAESKICTELGKKQGQVKCSSRLGIGSEKKEKNRSGAMLDQSGEEEKKRFVQISRCFVAVSSGTAGVILQKGDITQAIISTTRRQDNQSMGGLQRRNIRPCNVVWNSEECLPGIDNVEFNDWSDSVVGCDAKMEPKELSAIIWFQMIVAPEDEAGLFPIGATQSSAIGTSNEMKVL